MPGELPHLRLARPGSPLAEQFQRPRPLTALDELVRLTDVGRIPAVAHLDGLPSSLLLRLVDGAIGLLQPAYGPGPDPGSDHHHHHDDARRRQRARSRPALPS